MSTETEPNKDPKHQVEEVVLVEHVDDGHLLEDWEEQVIEVEVDGHEDGTYMEVDGGIMQLGDGVDMDDIFPSLLPVRDGQPFFTHNLPDLMSRELCFQDGSRGSLCFSKRGRRQLSVEGYLYNINGYVKEGEWNVWECVNNNCGGSVRTTGGYHDIRARTNHGHHCQADNIQIRLRIAIYDLRLLCEFTDTSIDIIYDNAVGKLSTDTPDVAAVFPSLEVMRNTLEDHRSNKIYRKRFEMQLLKDKQKQYNMTPEEIVYTDFFANQARYKRTKPFPDSMCQECDSTFGNNPNFPSQDQLVTHMDFDHGKPTVIERFQFKDVNLLEQWIRDMNHRSSYKMRKFGLFDEHMYYLCTLDDRVSQAKKGANCQQHCTSFIRIFDWRLAMKKELTEIVVDYCLDHPSHKETSTPQTNGMQYDYYSPEVFLREIEQRRQRTQKAFEARTRRYDLSYGSYVPKRSLPPPISAQVGPAMLFKTPYSEQGARLTAEAQRKGKETTGRKDLPPPHRRIYDLDDGQPSESPTGAKTATPTTKTSSTSQPTPATTPSHISKAPHNQMVDVKDEPITTYPHAAQRRIAPQFSPPRPRGRPRKTPRVDLTAYDNKRARESSTTPSVSHPEGPSKSGRQRKTPARFLEE